MSAALFRPMVEAAAAKGLRTIAYSRPGYGLSTPKPARTVADAAADTAEILDALGAGSFFTLGWSGGGPHALACAALLPDRCLAAASLAGVAPYRAEGLSWLAGMGDENLEEHGLAEEDPAALTPRIRRGATKLGASRAELVAAGLGR